MWVYEKKMEYPVKIKNPNPKLAKYVITQYGGPDGELGASLRYLSQRFSMPTEEARAILNDIGISASKLHILDWLFSFKDNLTLNVTPSNGRLILCYYV